MGFAVLVELQVGIPVERAAIVFLSLLGRVALVVGMVEVLLIGKAMKNVTAVAISDATLPIGIMCQSYCHTGLIRMLKSFISITARRIIGI